MPSTPEIDALAREVADLKRRLSATERAGRLRRSSVQIDGQAVTVQDSVRNSAEAVDTANSKSTIRYETYSPTNEPNSPGDVWYVRELVSGTILSTWEGQGGTSWAQRSLASDSIASTLQGKTINGAVISTAVPGQPGFIKLNRRIIDTSDISVPALPQHVIEFSTGHPDETQTAKILVVKDGDGANDNISLQMWSPKKGANGGRSSIQLIGDNGFLTGAYTGLSSPNGRIGSGTAPVLTWTGTVVTIPGRLDVKRMGFQLRRNSGSVTTSSGAPVDMSYNEVSSDNTFTVTATTATVPSGQAGLYAITGTFVVGLNLGSRAFMDINVSGTIYRFPCTTEDRVAGAVTVPLVDGDVVKATVFQTSGADRSWTGSLTCYRVGL